MVNRKDNKSVLIVGRASLFSTLLIMNISALSTNAEDQISLYFKNKLSSFKGMKSDNSQCFRKGKHRRIIRSGGFAGLAKLETKANSEITDFLSASEKEKIPRVFISLDENGKSIESAHFFNFIEGKSFEPRLSEITKSIAIELWGNPYTESTINLYTYKIVGSSVELGDIPVSLDTYFSNNRLSRYKLRHNNIQSKWMIVK